MTTEGDLLPALAVWSSSRACELRVGGRPWVPSPVFRTTSKPELPRPSLPEPDLVNGSALRLLRAFFMTILGPRMSTEGKMKMKNGS